MIKPLSDYAQDPIASLPVAEVKESVQKVLLDALNGKRVSLDDLGMLAALASMYLAGCSRGEKITGDISDAQMGELHRPHGCGNCE